MFIRNIPFIYKLGLWVKHLCLSSLTKKELISYLENNSINCLQIGAGENSLKGWFNTDFLPRKNIAFLDVTKKFDIPSESFDYVFSEHHIEHIYYKDASFMIKEAYRILKKDGVIRLCTPNLSAYLNSYHKDKSMADPYITDIMNNWINKGFHNAKNFVPGNGQENIAFFINDIFYNYEHKFIYDELTLINLLKSCGFSKAYVCKPSISAHEKLNGIESHNGITIPFTLAVEAIK